MSNKYVEFISDEHLLDCISDLHSSYVKAKRKIDESKFYKNKIDIFKLIFDSKFNGLSEKQVIEAEILRQVDKSVNNSIGTFHEKILGGIDGYERGNNSGYDIKSTDNTLFADIKNKHNTMNSSSAESLYLKLRRYADDYKEAKCYWVQILAKDSFNESWKGEINRKEQNHSRVFKISGDQFYALLTGRRTALYDLYTVLPRAIEDYLQNEDQPSETIHSVLTEIVGKTNDSSRTIFNQITYENFAYYSGFDKL